MSFQVQGPARAKEDHPRGVQAVEAPGPSDHCHLGSGRIRTRRTGPNRRGCQADVLRPKTGTVKSAEVGHTPHAIDHFCVERLLENV